MRRWFPVLMTIWTVPALRAHAAALVVSTASDGGPGSLREAIVTSNSNGTVDTVTFAAGMAGKTITPATPLPVLTEGGLTLNGDINADGKPDVLLNGAAAAGVGLAIVSASNLLRGLAIANFDQGIAITGPAATRNVVAGCYIGTNLRGTWALANDFGVLVSGSATYNTIGGLAPADRNVISGNPGGGIIVDASDRNKVFGNFIGLDRSGN